MYKLDQKFMALALKLALLGGRVVAPNPMVGAVIVKNGKVLGKGFHRKYGGPHAEVLAIEAVKNKSDLVGSTLYVTLEPCRHHGKTPPCWDLIQSVGLSRVVCGASDPFHGSQVYPPQPLQEKKFNSILFPPPLLKLIKGKLAIKCAELIQPFLTWMTHQRPHITVKIALSADGFVAGKDGQPVHFTSLKQDKLVHQLRAQNQAILVGGSTVLMDNPHLGVRHVQGHDPLRIILDARNLAPKSAKVFRDKNFIHVQKRVSLKKFFKELAQKGINSILVEPGPRLYQALKKEGLIDELIVLKGRKKLKEGLRIEL